MPLLWRKCDAISDLTVNRISENSKRLKVTNINLRPMSKDHPTGERLEPFNPK
jgi:hypothetical protein